MPTYEYECKSCGYVFEAFQRISEAPLSTCPQCGQAVRRLISGGVGVIFKGDGFYVTDKKGAGGRSSVGPVDKPGEDGAAPAAKESAAKTAASEGGGDRSAGGGVAAPEGSGKPATGPGGSGKNAPGPGLSEKPEKKEKSERPEKAAG